MEFRIADTFTDSLARLSGDEQKAVKTTAFDFQVNPANPGHKFHRVEDSKDVNFWSVRVSGDLRIIVHKSESSLLFCYVDHHDRAYAWAERRKLVTHPKTGAAQLVEIRETVKEIVVPVYVDSPSVDSFPSAKKRSAKSADLRSQAAAPRASSGAPIFADRSDDELLGYGVPPEWLGDVKRATEESLLALVDHLPAEAAEALLELATGGKPRAPATAAAGADPFAHPDAQRRFRVMTNVEELERALDYPWEKWTIFLHPEQRQWVERDYSGPARVAGSAGTGKTIVALHRAVFLARKHADARVLLTTFSDTLANALRGKLNRLLGNEPRLGERIDVDSLPALGTRLYRAHIGTPNLADRGTLREVLSTASAAVPGHKFSLFFLLTEWEQIVDAWHLETWDQYRDVARLGRKTRLAEAQRRVLWSIFEKVRAALAGFAARARKRPRGIRTGSAARATSVGRSARPNPFGSEGSPGGGPRPLRPAPPRDSLSRSASTAKPHATCPQDLLRIHAPRAPHALGDRAANLFLPSLVVARELLILLHVRVGRRGGMCGGGGS